jgi:uncharacterized protein YdaU (DUF1376 family)
LPRARDAALRSSSESHTTIFASDASGGTAASAIIWPQLAHFSMSVTARGPKMNFYKHHIGDYAKKTAHLSIAEHGAYLLMLQTYYATEKPLPTGKILYRLLRAESKADRDAIDSIIAQYWVETPAGLTNDRADLELADYRVFIEKQRSGGRASAAKRWGNGGHNGGHNDPMDLVVTKGVTPTPIPSKNSEDEASSGEAPPFDPRKQLWDLGVSLLGSDGRSIIGKACKRVGEPRVAEVLAAMTVKSPADPKTWFIKATQERGVVC